MPVKGLNFIPSEVQEKGRQEGFFPRNTDQQLRHFRHQWGARKPKMTVSDYYEDSLSQLHTVITRKPPGRFQRYIYQYRSSSNSKLFYMRATCITFVVAL